MGQSKESATARIISTSRGVIILSALMTLALFYLMHSLIRYGSDKELKEVPPNRIIEFVRQQRQNMAEEKEEELPEKLEMNEAPPPLLCASSLRTGVPLSSLSSCHDPLPSRLPSV